MFQSIAKPPAIITNYQNNKQFIFGQHLKTGQYLLNEESFNIGT